MEWLETLYVVCIGIGIIYSLLLLFFGDWSGNFHIPVLQPVILVSGVTAFGGCGILLSRLTAYAPGIVLLLSLMGGAILAVLSYFFWIKPMEKTESSTGYSMQELTGRLGLVSTSIPASGLGEVLVTMVSGTTHHMASSLEQKPIPEGTKVVVVEVKDHVLYVVPFEKENGERVV
ncbi:serine protease [Brevibacillus sp. SYP-B805]|uniref:NfeD family protein n=1 Tax=Brevibacillus sp. SYP-B805 TaxID=1578199 RepID=UPI0013EA970B|nr:NfeD family protein [Brevibacillus sp. SYP-B805]NGQ95277.1 serine protease [Brevibacillus sp. SYP-B805]